MLDDIRKVDTIEGLEAMLHQTQALKTGERSEEQRKIAILVIKIEDCVAWAKYTFHIEGEAQ